MCEAGNRAAVRVLGWLCAVMLLFAGEVFVVREYFEEQKSARAFQRALQSAESSPPDASTSITWKSARVTDVSRHNQTLYGSRYTEVSVEYDGRSHSLVIPAERLDTPVAVGERVEVALWHDPKEDFESEIALSRRSEGREVIVHTLLHPEDASRVQGTIVLVFTGLLLFAAVNLALQFGGRRTAAVGSRSESVKAA
jgi:hypothetical protein